MLRVHASRAVVKNFETLVNLCLPLKRHLYFAADVNSKFCYFFKNNKKGMIFHENRLLADDSHLISYLIL